MVAVVPLTMIHTASRSASSRLVAGASSGRSLVARSRTRRRVGTTMVAGTSTGSTAATSSSSSTSSAALVWSRMKTIPLHYPLGFGIILSGVKTSASDLLVQTVVEQKSWQEIDWKRNAAFATFGFIYLGGVQYTLYVPIFGRLFPQAATFAAKPLKHKLKDIPGMINVGLQTFLDQCVHHPLLYFPAFYMTKELVMGDTPPNLPRVLQDYRQNMHEDLVALWKIWVPATVINFAFMPMHLRIPFAAGISMVWTCVLSAMRGGDISHGEEIAGGAITRATYELFKEGLDEQFNTTPVDILENDSTTKNTFDHVSLSATGKDKPGIVAALTSHVATLGGNVTHSKMVRLGDTFIVQMHVAIPKGHESKTFRTSLNQNCRPGSVPYHCLEGLDIKATQLARRNTEQQTKAVFGMKIHCVGKDRYVI